MYPFILQGEKGDKGDEGTPVSIFFSCHLHFSFSGAHFHFPFVMEYIYWMVPFPTTSLIIEKIVYNHECVGVAGNV